MKITAPDDVETFTETKTSSKTLPENVEGAFLKEVKDIVAETPKIPSEFVAEQNDHNNANFQLEALKNCTTLCREEIIPRRIKILELIQSKSNELQHGEIFQQKNLDTLKVVTKELKENSDRLREKTTLVLSKHQELNDRLKDAMQILKKQCKSRTLAENKMAHDLIKFKKKAEDLKVTMTATTAKVNYCLMQENAQTEMMRKQTKPVYLDKNRAVFMRSNLSSMRENIEELVSRVKKMNKQMSELAETEHFEEK